MTTGKVRVVGQVAPVGGRLVGCSSDWERCRSIVIGGLERVVSSGEVRAMGWVARAGGRLGGCLSKR